MTTNWWFPPVTSTLGRKSVRERGQQSGSNILLLRVMLSRPVWLMFRALCKLSATPKDFMAQKIGSLKNLFGNGTMNKTSGLLDTKTSSSPPSITQSKKPSRYRIKQSLMMLLLNLRSPNISLQKILLNAFFSEAKD